MQSINLLKKYLKNMNIAKHFNKNLIMSVEDEEKFQASNKILMHNKLFTDEDEKEIMIKNRKV